VPEAAFHRAQGALAPMTQQKVELRAAMSQAGLFQRSPLVNAGGYQGEAGEGSAPARHRLRQKTGSIQCPLQYCGAEAETYPDHDVAGREEPRRSGTARTALASNGGDEEDGGSGRRQHQARSKSSRSPLIGVGSNSGEQSGGEDHAASSAGHPRRPSMAFAPKIRFAPDSPLEGSGFEPSVPLRECRRSEPLARKETSGVGNGVSSTAGPMVRSRFPPAASHHRHAFRGVMCKRDQ